jgi:hypothetical protein
MQKIDQMKLAILSLDSRERALLKAWFATLEGEERSKVSGVAPARMEQNAARRPGRRRADAVAKTPDPPPSGQRNRN